MSITQDILNKRNESRKQAVEKTPTKKRPRKAKSKDIVPMSNVLDETAKEYTDSSLKENIMHSLGSVNCFREYASAVSFEMRKC